MQLRSGVAEVLPAAAALIWTLAQELLYVTDVALEEKKKKKERKTENCHLQWHDGPWGHYAKQNKSNKDKYHYDFSYKTKKQKIKTKNNLKTKNKTKLIDREQTGGFKK